MYSDWVGWPGKIIFIQRDLPFLMTQLNSTITAICSLSRCNGAVLFYSQHDNFERTPSMGIHVPRVCLMGGVGAHGGPKWNATIAQGVVNARPFAGIVRPQIMCFSKLLFFGGLQNFFFFFFRIYTRFLFNPLQGFILFKIHMCDQLTVNLLAYKQRLFSLLSRVYF